MTARWRLVTRTLLTLTAIAAVAAAPVDGASGATSLTAGDQDQSTAQDPWLLERAIAFRTKSGFEADPAYVRESFANPGFSSEAWGVPLNLQELADLARRVSIQDRVVPAFEAAEALAESAGQYFDQLNGGIPVFLSTSDPSEFASKVVAAIPEGVPSRFEQVALTTIDLRRLQGTIVNDMPMLRGMGIDVQSVGIDAKANGVSVGIERLTDDSVRALHDLYGATITVREEGKSQGGDACTSRADCLPLKGGIKIFRHLYEASMYCTSTMLVRANTTFYMLTAGHCVEKAGVGNRWDHKTTTWGTGFFETWAGGADADAGLITIDAGDVPATKNLFYATSSADIRPFTNYKSTSGQAIDAYVCRSGWTSGLRCGNIIDTGATRNVDGKLIDNQWLVDFGACLGDSGGPYFLYNDIWGIHSDSTDGCNPSNETGWYSPIVWATTTLADKGHPVVMCLVAACGL